MGNVTDEEKQDLFEEGQDDEKHIRPLSGPCQGAFESDEDYQERVSSHEAGKRSVRNNR